MTEDEDERAEVVTRIAMDIVARADATVAALQLPSKEKGALFAMITVQCGGRALFLSDERDKIQNRLTLLKEGIEDAYIRYSQGGLE